MGCPDPVDPVDPGGAALDSCASAQALRSAAPQDINDSYYMRFADGYADPATFNSSRAKLTIPPGARVAFARLNWAGNTGRIKNADSAVAAAPACNTRHFLDGAGAAVTPSGIPAGTPVRLGVGETSADVPAVQFTADPDDAYTPNNPQYYSAYATTRRTRTSRRGLPGRAASGTALPVTVGDIWTPEGFGCFAGLADCRAAVFEANIQCRPGLHWVRDVTFAETCPRSAPEPAPGHGHPAHSLNLIFKLCCVVAGGQISV
jgi:large repetitive protein